MWSPDLSPSGGRQATALSGDGVGTSMTGKCAAIRGIAALENPCDGHGEHDLGQIVP